jgi:dTDP-4-amino-4,6-dideoxygalactose transaminase
MVQDPTSLVPITRPLLPPVERFHEIIADIFESRMLSNFSKYTQLLEKRAAMVLDHPDPKSVSSCDIGLTLAWKALQCPPGEVIVPSFTFCSTVNALAWNNHEPVFAEVDPETYCIDVEDARRLITPRTVGLCGVHVFGLPAAIEPLQQLATEHGLAMVFDAAHGLGGRYQGAALGSFGDASAFSMSGTKLVTSGEGGLVTFRDPDAADRFSYLRVYGFKGDYNCRYVGLNGKLSELNAALGWLSLDLYDGAVARRQAQVEHYKHALAGCADIEWQTTSSQSEHGYKDLALRFRKPEQRVAVETALAASGVMTKRYFFPVHRMDAYRQHSTRALRVTDELHDRLLCVPIYHDLSFEQIDQIVAVILAQFRRPTMTVHTAEPTPRPPMGLKRDQPQPARSEVA